MRIARSGPLPIQDGPAAILTPMSWIRTLTREEARGQLAELLAAHADPRTGEVDEILLVHTLVPESLRAHLALYGSAMGGTPGLPRVERELIALVVSRLNGCNY